LQEWEYETKWGVMATRNVGSSNLTASVNYDHLANNPDAYARLGHDFGSHLSLGASLGTGHGLSYGSIYDRAAGLDATAHAGGWQLLSEYLWLRRQSFERFHFGYARLSYEKLGRWKPYVSRYSWNETVASLGAYHSSVAGLSYQLRPDLSIDAAVSRVPGTHVNWVQLHWTPQWTYYDGK